MLSLRNRFGIPGVISVIALVFAMLGGAYAASNNGGGKATASAKAKRGPRGPKGATGPAGPAGAQGPAGANGKDGSNGTNGSNGERGATGAAGQSVTTTSEPPEGNCGEQEGVKLTSASGTNYVCNGAEGPQGIQGTQGPEGSPWTLGGTLPAGATETGSWFGTMPSAGEGDVAAISFTLPLKAQLEFTKGHLVTKSGEELNYETFELEPAVNCLGSAAKPTAKPGELCVYIAQAGSGEIVGLPERSGDTPTAFGVSTTGAVLNFLSGTAGEELRGTFAVTG